MKKPNTAASVATALIALALAGCATPPAPPAPTPANAIVSVAVWEGGCFTPALCTTYSITLTPDDAFRLDAQNRVRTPGVSESRLPGAFAKAVDALTQANFAALPDRLDASSSRADAPVVCVPHAPGLRVTVIRADGSSKALFWDQGCPIEAGRAVRDGLRAAYTYQDLIAPPR